MAGRGAAGVCQRFGASVGVAETAGASARYRLRRWSVPDALSRGRWTCSGVEVSQGAAERARAKGLSVLSPAELGQTAAGQFDVVTLVNVLETVTDPAAIVRAMTRQVKPQGIIAVRVSNGLFAGADPSMIRPFTCSVIRRTHCGRLWRPAALRCFPCAILLRAWARSPAPIPGDAG